MVGGPSNRTRVRCIPHPLSCSIHLDKVRPLQIMWLNPDTTVAPYSGCIPETGYSYNTQPGVSLRLDILTTPNLLQPILHPWIYILDILLLSTTSTMIHPTLPIRHSIQPILQNTQSKSIFQHPLHPMNHNHLQ